MSARMERRTITPSAGPGTYLVLVLKQQQQKAKVQA